MPCLQVGGQSTRPGASIVNVEDECFRVVCNFILFSAVLPHDMRTNLAGKVVNFLTRNVFYCRLKLPVVDAIRREHPQIAISIDTFRSQVAAEALDAGADIVNDVSAGHLDVAMRSTVGTKRAAWIMMHMRGTPETMMSHAMTDYGHEGVVAGSARELCSAVTSAVGAGIPRWDVVVDPGVGFAKTACQNVDLLQHLGMWKKRVGSYPCVVGLSRKSALCNVVPHLRDQPANERDFASAGAVVAAMAGGADVFRLHNAAVRDAVAAAYALWPRNTR
jgi:dihydropteroate synthase